MAAYGPGTGRSTLPTGLRQYNQDVAAGRRRANRNTGRRRINIPATPF